MLLNDTIGVHNPKLMTQQAQLVSARGMQDYNALIQSLEQTSRQVKTVVVLFKRYNRNVFDLEKFEPVLLEQGFKKTELQWYYIYEKDET